MADDATVLLLGAGKEAGTSTNVTSGRLKASQKRTKRAALAIARALVEGPGNSWRARAFEADRRAPPRVQAPRPASSFIGSGIAALLSPTLCIALTLDRDCVVAGSVANTLS